MQPPATNEPTPDGTAVCPRHGLRYNPRLSTGCVQCRRTVDEVAPGWMMPMAVGLSLVGLAALAIPFRAGIRSYFSGPNKATATIPADAPVEHRRCLLRGPEASELAAGAAECKQACDGGWGASCRRLAGICGPGSPIPPGDECKPGPAALLEQACKGNDALACTLVSEQRKAEVFWKACNGGLGRSCADLAPLCDEKRAALTDGAPTTAWAFLSTPALREGCSGGAAKLYERGCTQGDWASCEQPGVSARVSPERLRSMLETACDRADPAACRRLASQVGKDDPALAAALVAYAKELEACSGADCAGVKRWRDRVSDERPRVQQQSATEHERGCEQGRVSSCWEAAEAYALGTGVRQDSERADKLNARARTLLKAGCTQKGGSCASDGMLRGLENCDRGDGNACLAAVRAQGGGAGGEAAALFRRGVRLLRADCDGRKGEACYQISTLHQQGTLPGGEDAQVDWLRRGCDSRHGLSCYEVGERLYDGRGVPRERTSAERMLRRSSELLTAPCEAGDAASCRALQRLYTDNHGVPADETKAALYAERAAKLTPRPAASP